MDENVLLIRRLEVVVEAQPGGVNNYVSGVAA